jgi:hypothetical protein
MLCSEILRRVALVSSSQHASFAIYSYRCSQLADFFTLMMEAIRSSEMSVLTRATRCNIPEDGILHSHRRGNLNPCIALTGWAL